MSSPAAQPTVQPSPHTAGTIPEDLTVAAAFAAVAGEHGDRMALHTLDGRVTYRELAAAAEAWALTAPAGPPVGERDVVLMLAGFGLGSVSAVLGMFGTGRVLAPLDPALPAGRTSSVITALRDNGYRITAVITDAVNHPKPRLCS